MMQRACTYGAAIKTPRNPGEYEEIIVTICQNQREIIRRTKDSLSLSEDGVFIGLSQEETKLFRPSLKSVMGRRVGQPAYMQIRAYAHANEVVGSKSWAIDVYDTQNEEVLGDA